MEWIQRIHRVVFRYLIVILIFLGATHCGVLRQSVLKVSALRAA